LAFADDVTLYSAGDGGLRRWNVETGTQELVVHTPPGYWLLAWFSGDAGKVMTFKSRFAEFGGDCEEIQVCDTRTGAARTISTFHDCPVSPFHALSPSGAVAAITSRDGTVRVGSLDGGTPHLLVGHKGSLLGIAISPDLRWIATGGQDSTLRLWPMPDLSKPPLHALPLEQLLAKLHSLTNLRAVRDPSSSTGWTIEAGPFPGWKHVPTW
jgi:WD40 repeat protein